MSTYIWILIYNIEEHHYICDTIIHVVARNDKQVDKDFKNVLRNLLTRRNKNVIM